MPDPEKYDSDIDQPRAIKTFRCMMNVTVEPRAGIEDLIGKLSDAAITFKRFKALKSKFGLLRSEKSEFENIRKKIKHIKAELRSIRKRLAEVEL